MTGLSNIHLATFTENAVHAHSPQLQVILHRMEEAGDHSWQQINTLDVFNQRSAEVAICCLDMWQESN